MAKKTTTYYNFLAPSSLSFKLLHKGRNMIIRFSTPYNSASRFMTTDKELADKIMEHRWFRKGLIKLQEEVIDHNQVIEEDQSPAVPLAKKPTYTVGKMKMGSSIPPQALKAGTKKPTYTVGKMKMGSSIPPQALKAGTKTTGIKTAKKEVSKTENADEGNTDLEAAVNDVNQDTGEVDTGTDENMDTSAEDTTVENDQDAEMTLESVETFMEAKEYLVKVHGVDGRKIKSNSKLAEVCAELGIEFPNFSFK